MATPRIIVIENDKEIREVVHELLEAEGYKVESFSDGLLALSRLKKNPETCLVLLDLLMPVMDGWEFMAEFSKLPVTIVPIPVIIYSVTKEKEGATNAMGARGFLKKPASVEVLLQLVREHCSEKKKSA